MLPERLVELVAARPAPAGPHLEVQGGPEDGRTCPLHVGVTRIGSDPDNQLDLKLDATVSPVHARIEWRAGRFHVVDSGGGTTVDGSPVAGSALLQPGQVIRVGNTRLLFCDRRAAGRATEARG